MRIIWLYPIPAGLSIIIRRIAQKKSISADYKGVQKRLNGYLII